MSQLIKQHSFEELNKESPLTLVRSESISSPVSSFGKRSTPCSPEEMVKKDMKSTLNKLSSANFDRIVEKILNINTGDIAYSVAVTHIKTLTNLILDTILNQHIGNVSSPMNESKSNISHYANILMNKKVDLSYTKLFAKLCREIYSKLNTEVKVNESPDNLGIRLIKDIKGGGKIFKDELKEICEKEFNSDKSIILNEIHSKVPESEYMEVKYKKRNIEFTIFLSSLNLIKLTTNKSMFNYISKLFFGDENKTIVIGEIDFTSLYKSSEMECGLIMFLYFNNELRNNEQLSKSIITKMEEMLNSTNTCFNKKFEIEALLHIYNNPDQYKEHEEKLKRMLM